MRNGLFTSPGLDDKVGVWVVMETLRLLKGRDLQAAVFCVSTVQEEIGLRGATTSAYGIHPHVGIAVDVTHATDTPGNEKKQLGEVKLGAGPVLARGPNINPHVFDRLRRPRRTRRSRRRSAASPRRRERTPMPCSYRATAWPRDWSGIPIDTCIVRWKSSA